MSQATPSLPVSNRVAAKFPNDPRAAQIDYPSSRLTLKSLLGYKFSGRDAPIRHIVKLHDKSEIIVWEWPAIVKKGIFRKKLVDRADLKQNVVFCVHGLTRNGHDFDALAQKLRQPVGRQEGRCVMAVDIVGRGQSSWLNNKILYSYATYQAHLIEILDRMRLHQVDWVGTSMGGILGMMVGSTMPHRVSKLVLNDIGAVVAHRGLLRIAKYVKEFAKNPVHFTTKSSAMRWLKQAMEGYGTLSAREWQYSLRVMTQMSLDQEGEIVYIPAFDPALGDQFDVPANDLELWHLWNNLKQPVLLLRGANSDILDAGIATLMAERTGVKLITFPGRGHAPTLIPNEQTNEIRDWLASFQPKKMT